MPGMMDTILNLGLNDATVEGVIASTGNARFAYDCYRRFVSMYGDVVLGCKPESDDEGDVFEERLEAMKKAKGVTFDTELTADDLKDLVAEFKAAVRERTGKDFPDDPRAQLWGAISAVFGSWGNDRAVAYRRMYDIPDDWGTAVNVQTMVYGNTGDESGTGVAFTRNPASGENEFYGEFLVNAQGEDVVAGVRTPRQVIELRDVWPDVFDELMAVRQTLESELRDMQDFEFTIEKGRLFMLQTRNGKRTGLAAIRIAVDMADQGLITPDEALMRIEPEQLNQLLRPVFGADEKLAAVKEGRVKAKGLPAGPGAATGRVVFNAQDAVAWAATGEKVLLVRDFTSPDDIRGMDAAQGILTAQGGMTSHAALVARQMGKVCIVGCGALDIDMKSRSFKVDDASVKEGDWISIDGFTGEVILGALDTRPPEVLQVLLEKSMTPEESGSYRYYEEIMEWADKARTLGVRTNADQPDQSANAIAFGAEGIGLCRTEHMFFEGERIMSVREMILAETREAREAALAKLLPMQRDDFAGIFRVMGERHVTIRTLDPPLHEFLPHGEKDTAETAAALGVPEDVVRAKVEDLHESNPMLGHRGCRLGIAFPEITAMQARAILEAACLVKKEGLDVHPEIMIPLVGTKKELEHQAAIVRAVAADVFAEQGTSGRVPGRHHDRDPARGAHRQRDRRGRRVLQLRHQRPHADDARRQPRRRRQVPPAVHQRGIGDLAGRPVRDARPERRGPAGRDRHRARPQHAAGPQGRHLRRAGRRPRDGQVLPPREDGLRELLAVPPPGGAPRRGAGRHRGARRAAAREVAAATTGAGPGRREARPGRRFSLAGRRGRPVARLGREIEVKLADGRALVVRDARKRDARGVTGMLDAVAAEPQVTLVLRPGEASPSDWRRRITDSLRAPRGLFLVADSAGSVVGNLGLWPDANPASAHVAWIGMSVADGFRGAGAGGALLETALEWAASAGFRRAVLGVFPENARAMAFYERHGFVREGLRREQYRRGDRYHDEVLMARPLTSR